MEGSNMLLGDGELSTNPSKILNNQVSNEDQVRMEERVHNYFTGSELINKQFISSYNELITSGIMDVVLAHDQVSSNTYMLKFSNAQLGTPDYMDNVTGVFNPITSLKQCMDLGITYAAPLMVDVDVLTPTGGRNSNFVLTTSHSRMRIGMIPVMVRGMNCVADDISSEDFGGYFIIKGQKKIICLHENPVVPNQMFVQDENGRKTCKVVSVGSKSQGASSPPRSEVKVYCRRGRYVVEYGPFCQPFPIVIMLKALGLLSTEIILDLVAPAMDEVFDGAAQSFAESLMPNSYKHFHDQKRALSHVGDKALVANPHIFSNMRGKRHPMVKQILKQMMPHLTFEADESVNEADALELSHLATAKFICLMARSLLQYEENPSTPINFRAARIDLPGLTMGALFEKLFIGFANEMMNRVVEQGSLSNLDDIITYGFDAAMLTGKWELDGYLPKVTQALPSDSFVSATKSMMQIRGTLPNEPGVLNPYLLQADDQTDLTLLKQLNVLTRVTSRYKEGPIKAILFSDDHCLPIVEGSFLDYYGERAFLGEMFLPEYDVFFNGKFIGNTHFSYGFVEEFRAERRRGSIPYTVSVYVDDRIRSIAIFSDSGRLTHPYIRVENCAPVATLAEICRYLDENPDTAVKKLIAEGIIEFLDGYERENRVIASHESDITEGTTHLELAASPLRPDVPPTSNIV